MNARSPDNSYDYVLIGSGVAGSTIAAKLLEHNSDTSILILEAGPKVAMKDRRYWWDYVVSWRKPYDHCEDRDADNPSFDRHDEPSTQTNGWHSKGSRTMMYGGSTVHWGGWSMRFKPEDFHLRTNTGRGGDWPYGYGTLEPYYCRADKYLSVSDGSILDRSGDWHDDPWRSQAAPMPHYPWTESDSEVVRGLHDLGLGAGHMPMARYRKCMSTGTCKYCPFGARFSGALIMDDLLSLPDANNLKYIGMAPATKLIASSKKRIDAVEYLDPTTGEATRAYGERIIICSGAYEAPKLLMASTSKYWKAGIGNDTDLAGRYAISHRFLSVVGLKKENKEKWIQEYDFPSLMSRSYDTPQDQEDGKIFIMKYSGNPNVDIAGLMKQGKTREEIDQEIVKERRISLSAFMEEFGEYENRFSIGEGNNRFGLPRTKINFEAPADFEDRAKKNIDKMAEIIRASGYEIEMPTDRYSKAPVVDSHGNPMTGTIGTQDGHHTSSTTRMGVDETEGVVDEDLKVFGTENLYICSNSALPTCAAVNPTLTLVAVTLKLTDHLIATTP